MSRQAFRLVHSFLMVQDTAICATGLDLLSNMLEVPAVAVCMAREVKPQPDFVVQALVGPVSSSEIEIQRCALPVHRLEPTPGRIAGLLICVVNGFYIALGRSLPRLPVWLAE